MNVCTVQQYCGLTPLSPSSHSKADLGFKTRGCAEKASFKFETVTQQESLDKVLSRGLVGAAMHSYNLLSALQSGTKHSAVHSQSQSDQQEPTGAYWRKAVKSPFPALLPPFHRYCIKSGCLPPAEYGRTAAAVSPRPSTPIRPSPRIIVWGFSPRTAALEPATRRTTLGVLKVRPASRCGGYPGT